MAPLITCRAATFDSYQLPPYSQLYLRTLGRKGANIILCRNFFHHYCLGRQESSLLVAALDRRATS